ncbi:DUF6498-containing protein [Patescibacteria group bacterium]|jgi:hypothetical protein|nr:DUF6498-containing protein [Patescibacteria group bacterium]
MTQQTRDLLVRDPSLWLLIASNAITIYLALTQGWNLGTLMWVYWIQSVIIGVFHFIRILRLEKFSIEGVKVNGKEIPVTSSEVLVKGFFATFFAIHYGIFHFVYLVFLIVGVFTPVFGSGAPEWREVGFASLIFFGNHLFSFFFNQSRDSHEQNIGAVMMYPYGRILPMHITIIIGAFVNALPLFLILKAVADAVTHVLEHALLRKGRNTAPVLR